MVFVNVSELGADIYLFSAYKTYGPHQGLMVIRRDLGMRLPNQGHYFNEGSLYKRFTPAGPDHAQVAACAGMADYMDAVYAHHFSVEATAAQRAVKVHDLFRDHEARLAQPILDYLSAKIPYICLARLRLKIARQPLPCNSLCRVRWRPRSWPLSALWRGVVIFTRCAPCQRLALRQSTGCCACHLCIIPVPMMLTGC